MQVVIGIALVLAAASVAGAGPLDTPGAMKALNCSACHGFAGQSAGDTMPILAGLWPEYFKKAIADYASGKRPSTEMEPDRKSTRLNSSHRTISYAVFCLKKKSSLVRH